MARTRIPLRLGHFLSLSGIVIAIISLIFASATPLLLRPLAYLVSWFSLWFFPHCLTHFIVGSLFRIRFRYYFFGSTHLAKVVPEPIARWLLKVPVLGIRTEVRSLMQAAPRYRYLMFASGAVSSMLLPFAVPVYLFSIREGAFAFWFALLSFANLLITAILSPRAGDFYKAKRSASRSSG